MAARLKLAALSADRSVAHVDYDPVVLAHARALLTSNAEGATEYIDGDLRNTGPVLTRAARLVDFTRPVAVTLLSILHAVPDDGDPYVIVATLMDAVPPGSYLAVFDPVALQGLYDSFKGKVLQQFQWRTREQVARFFTGMDLVEVGLVRVDDWRQEPGTDGTRKSAMWAAVGRKS